MKPRILNGLAIIVAATFGTISALAADQLSSPKESAEEPAKSMASAHDNFVKGKLKESGECIDKATDSVKQASEKVSDDAKAGMRSAGAQLNKLGTDVKSGVVKTDAELKHTFAKVDYQIADCWHKTAAQARKSGKDSTEALKKAGAAVSDAAKWSGNHLKEAQQSTVEALKKAEASTREGVKTSAAQVDKWFKNIGDGIKDLKDKL